MTRWTIYLVNPPRTTPRRPINRPRTILFGDPAMPAADPPADAPAADDLFGDPAMPADERAGCGRPVR